MLPLAPPSVPSSSIAGSSAAPRPRVEVFEALPANGTYTNGALTVTVVKNRMKAILPLEKWCDPFAGLTEQNVGLMNASWKCPSHELEKILAAYPDILIDLAIADLNERKRMLQKYFAKSLLCEEIAPLT